MYTNETMLTPFFRYFLWYIEKYKESDLQQACKRINHLYLDNKKEELVTVGEDWSFLTRTVELLKKKSHGDNEMRTYWEEKCELIEKEQCKRCAVHCKKCQLYFWKELGEIFFQKTNDLRHSGTYLPIRKLPKQIERNLSPSKKAADLYYANHCQKKTKLADGCIILKGMSSSTPSLLNGIYDTNQYSGGGFYLRYKGIGVAIDPGYHFLENLHHYGLSVLDVHVVIITHEHIDHNHDMRLLDDLHYAVCEYGQDGKKRTIDWYLDEVSYKIAKMYQKNGTGFNEKANILHLVSPKKAKSQKDFTAWQNIKLNTDGSFRLDCFKTQHIEDTKKESSYKQHTFGCQFQLTEGNESRFLAYTSDTRYFSALVGQINMPDVLIANISGILEDDFMLVNPKQRHLGYYGCYHLLKDIWIKFKRLPGLVVLSEFWNGKNDIRYDTASFLERQVRKDCGVSSLRIVPAEVGMTFHVMDQSLRCSQCGAFTKDFFVRKPNGYQEKIKIFCRSCIY